MDCEKIGRLIRHLRREKGMTQRQLAERLGVSDRAVSKWERGCGCPDVSLLSDLSIELSVGVEALLSGEVTDQEETGKNMKHTKYYVCPRCGNLLLATGEAAVTCCGRSLEPLEAVKAEEVEKLRVEQVEDERFLTTSHPHDQGAPHCFCGICHGGCHPPPAALPGVGPAGAHPGPGPRHPAVVLHGARAVLSVCLKERGVKPSGFTPLCRCAASPVLPSARPLSPGEGCGR